jgi:prophage regulatory protein
MATPAVDSTSLPISAPDRILRDPEVTSLTGIGRTSRWYMIRAGRFPKPVELTARTVGWRLSDIVRWIESRPYSSDDPARAQAASKATATKRRKKEPGKHRLAAHAEA